MKTSIFQSFKFLLFSLFSFGLAIGLTDFFYLILHWPAEIAFAITLVVLVAVNFSACRFVIFKAQNQDPRRQLGRFITSSLVFRGLEYLGFLIFFTGLHLPHHWVLIGVMGSSFVGKYFFYRFFVFGEGYRMLRGQRTKAGQEACGRPVD